MSLEAGNFSFFVQNLFFYYFYFSIIVDSFSCSWKFLLNYLVANSLLFGSAILFFWYFQYLEIGLSSFHCLIRSLFSFFALLLYFLRCAVNVI